MYLNVSVYGEQYKFTINYLRTWLDRLFIRLRNQLVEYMNKSAIYVGALVHVTSIQRPTPAPEYFMPIDDVRRS